MPFPHHFTRCLSRRPDLDERVRKKMLVAGHLRPSSGGNEFFVRLPVMNDQQYVAVRQSRYVMMRQLRRAIELEIPNDFTIPSELLNAPAVPRSGSKDKRIAANRPRPQQVPVLQKHSR